MCLDGFLLLLLLLFSSLALNSSESYFFFDNSPFIFSFVLGRAGSGGDGIHFYNCFSKPHTPVFPTFCKIGIAKMMQNQTGKLHLYIYEYKLKKKKKKKSNYFPQNSDQTQENK
jgi:hypothetical protein